MASGMAGKVRRATDSDEFDLANYDQAKCDELCKAAFAQPLPISNMVKLSFVVGGGKLVRQKYTDDLPKVFMSSLTAIGFEDDNSACLEGAGGKFKFQHDTGKNLKFVHVFPNISGAPQAAAGEADEEAEEEAVPQTPEEMLMTCDMDVFEQIIPRQLGTYGQMKALMDLLKARITKLEEIEAKMAKLEQLSAEEQTLFDGVGVHDLKEKSKKVSAELQAFVDAGRLTSAERAGLLEQFEGRLSAVEAELAKAEADGKAKKVEALQKQVETIRNTRNTVKDCTPMSLPPLKHAQDIQKFYTKLAQLTKIEKASKGNYTVDELKKLGERPELEEAIAELEKRSRGWLEAEDVFQARLQACKAGAARAKAAPPPPGGGSGGYAAAASRSSGSGGYSTVSRGGARPAKAKGAAPSTRNAFGALDS